MRILIDLNIIMNLSLSFLFFVIYRIWDGDGCCGIIIIFQRLEEVTITL